MKLNDLLKTSGNDSDLIFNDKHRAIKNYRLMQWAKWATFGLYIVAVFMLYVADVWGIGSFIEQKSNDWVALIVFSAIAFVLAFFLASSKEAVYEDIALHRAEGYKLKTSQIVAMGLFLTSGLLFEMFSTSNNQQHIANSAAEGSSMMKEVTGSNVTLSTGSTALTQDLQAAQMRLADCKVRMEKALAKGKTYDCAQSEANVAAVRESMQMANAMANDTNAAALNAKTDAMFKVREHFDKPMFKEIGKVAGTDNNGGMLIVIGVLIFIFECQHIMALFAYANALRRIKGNGGKPNTIQSQGNNGYGIAPPLSPFDSAKMSVAEYAAKVEAGLKSSPEVIATEYARAQHGRNQQMEAMGNAAKTIGDKLDSMSGKPDRWRSDAPVIKEAQGFKQSPDQAANVSKLYQSEMAKHEAGKVFNDESPTPPIKHQSVAETIRALVDAVKKSGSQSEADIQVAVFNGYQKLFNPADLDDGDLLKVAAKIAKSTAPAMPFNQRTGATGLQNPVLGTAEEHYSLPLPTTTLPFQKTVSDTVPPTVPARCETVADTVPARSQNGSGETVQNGLTGEAKRAEIDLYPQWIAKVSDKEITPGARDCKRFISQSTKSNDDKTGLTVQEMGRIWLNWNQRALQDGILKANPDYSNGKPKYILA
ncbi:hypothetical protein SAMN05660964_03566 [Thiothrix caldifontis]|uniref:Uncharacterized protein n=1 Tax=Thiothrix caldifontis TaxID=525918 RepID=A0A1H4GM07_9GAMM|nr:hypothetical protein [Thiothrix caldifontis]SEB10537.1 hypothetical protein SAMN05660964_03566 [Thiothrix caldifontis]